MNLFFRKLRQSPIFAIILCILLAVSSAATTVGAAGWSDAVAQEATIDENYTTIAIPKDVESSLWVMENSPYYIGEDLRILLSARVAGGKAMSTGALEPLNYQGPTEIYPYMMSVFAVECLSVADNKVPATDTAVPMSDYNVICRKLDAVSIIDAYDLPPYDDEILVKSAVRRADGSIPFEVGKTYLVRGMYHDYYYGYQDIPDSFDFFKDWETLKRPGRRTLEATIIPLRLNMDFFSGTRCVGGVPHWRANLTIYDAGEGIYNWTKTIGEWPYFTEYEGDWRDFLETDEGAVWRDEIIPYMELNHESVSVMLTDNIDSMYAFCAGSASVLDGRKFAQEEYDKGENVCMVSAAYAQLNGLSVGDTINMDYYDPAYYSMGAEDIAGFQGTTVEREPIAQEARMGVQKDYEIVGIYAAPEWMSGAHSFHADTVIVPKASAPNPEFYYGASQPVLHSLILKNGTIEATEQYMAEQGHADEYFYFDHGYSEALEAIATMKANGQRLMFIGAASLALVGLLFLWLYDRRTAKIARNMRLLGVKKSEVWLQDMKAILLLELIAIILGTVAAAIIASASFLTALVEFAAIALVSGVWTLGTVNRNLMRKKP